MQSVQFQLSQPPNTTPDHADNPKIPEREIHAESPHDEPEQIAFLIYLFVSVFSFFKEKENLLTFKKSLNFSRIRLRKQENKLIFKNQIK